jgi:rhodanese-related sulfurtransferase
MKRLLMSLLLLSSVLTPFCLQAADPGFPGRKLFFDAPVMELAELEKKIDDVVVVDVRSKFEFDTLQIKGAMNIPLADRAFGSKIGALRKANNKPIVFYCNGRSCLKSYEAVMKARTYRVANVYAYDAGIFEWAKTYPQRAVLLGKSPVSPRDLIEDDKFQAHLLTPDDFVTMVGPSSLVLDVRDTFQRADMVAISQPVAHLGLDDRTQLRQHIERAKKEKKTLMVFDAVGHQVRWLQYYLESEGLKDYYFMKGGAEAYMKRTGK